MNKMTPIAMACAFALAGCNGSNDNGTSDSSTDNQGLATTTLNISTKDYFDDSDIAGANVVVTEYMGDDTNTYSGITDENGDVAVTVYQNADRLVVSSDANSYGEYSAIVTNGDTSVELYLQPTTGVVTFPAAQDSDLAVNSLDIVSLSANSLVDSDGNVATGDVTAEITVIDPSVDPELMPGTFETIDPATGNASQIESFGAVSVTFEDSEGNEYNLSPDQTATVRIPLGTNSDSAPDTIPLYYFDDQSGYWVEEGTATLVSDPSGDYYEGTVSHFTTWNADMLYDSVEISGCVQNAAGEALRYASIRTQGVDYSGRAYGYSDQNGQFTVSAKQNSEILLTATSMQGASRTYTRSTGSDDETLSECITLGSASGSDSDVSASVTLTWGENPRDLDTQFIGPADASGDNRFLVYFRNKEVNLADSNIWLDVDDTTSYGPEVTSIDSFPYEGRYSYAVYRYSDSGDIQASPARVKLEMGNETQVFAPPSGEPTICWAVFDFVVDANGGVSVEPVGSWQEESYCYPDRDEGNNNEIATQSRQSTHLNKSTLLKDLISDKYYAK